VKDAAVGVGRVGTMPLVIPLCRSIFGGKVLLEGVVGESVEISGAEMDIFRPRNAVRLEEDMFFLRTPGAEDTLPTGREGDDRSISSPS
jgi:hypothetical protein